jgi:ribosomal-protein-alanine N-acetyltransferase
MVRFETERLLIRDHVEDDEESLRRLLMDAKAMHYLPDIFCRTPKEVRENLYTAVQEARNPDRTKYYFAIERNPDHQYIGEIGFTRLARAGPKGKIAGLGYFILPECWGNGYVTEAAAAAIDFGFQHCGLHKMTCGCLKENTASERVMIKCGMTKEADFKAHVWHEKQWKDRVEYRLLRDEWTKKHQNA